MKATWQEVTLRDAIRLVNIKATEQQIQDSIIMESMELNDYMIEAVSVFSDCPVEILKKTEPIHVVVLFDHIRYIVHGIYNTDIESHKPIGRETVKFKGIEYHLPKSLWISDQEIPMHKEPAKHVTEAGNILQMVGDLKEKGVESMNLFCAIYLKEHPEEFYDENKIAIRAEKFKDLPMDVVWDVFFYMYFSLCSYAINFRASLENQGVRNKIKNTTRGFLRWLNKVLQATRTKWAAFLSGSWLKSWITMPITLKKHVKNENKTQRNDT